MATTIPVFFLEIGRKPEKARVFRFPGLAKKPSHVSWEKGTNSLPRQCGQFFNKQIILLGASSPFEVLVPLNKQGGRLSPGFFIHKVLPEPVGSGHSSVPASLAATRWSELLTCCNLLVCSVLKIRLCRSQGQCQDDLSKVACSKQQSQITLKTVSFSFFSRASCLFFRL